MEEFLGREPRPISAKETSTGVLATGLPETYNTKKLQANLQWEFTPNQASCYCLFWKLPSPISNTSLGHEYNYKFKFTEQKQDPDNVTPENSNHTWRKARCTSCNLKASLEHDEKMDKFVVREKEDEWRQREKQRERVGKGQLRALIGHLQPSSKLADRRKRNRYQQQQSRINCFYLRMAEWNSVQCNRKKLNGGKLCEVVVNACSPRGGQNLLTGWWIWQQKAQDPSLVSGEQDFSQKQCSHVC